MTAIPNLTPAYGEIFLALAGMALLMVGVFRKKDPVHGVTLLALLAFAVAAVLALVTNGTEVVTFNGLFVVNAFTGFAKLLVLLGAGLAMLLALPWARN